MFALKHVPFAGFLVQKLYNGQYGWVNFSINAKYISKNAVKIDILNRISGNSVISGNSINQVLMNEMKNK